MAKDYSSWDTDALEIERDRIHRVELPFCKKLGRSREQLVEECNAISREMNRRSQA